MRILIDECLPRRLKEHLPGYEARTVVEMGWGGLKNGALLAQAESNFDVFLTADQNLPYQQRLEGRKIGVIIVAAKSNRIFDLIPMMKSVLEELPRLKAGEVRRIIGIEK